MSGLGDEPRGVSDLLRRATTAAPDALALVDGRLRMSWAELDAAVNRTGQAFAERTEPGERLALQVGSGADFVTSYLAAQRAGLVVVPINPAYTVGELRYVLADSGAVLLVTGSLDAVREFERLRAGLREVVVAASSAPEGLPTLNEIQAAAASAADPGMDRVGEQTAVLLYTSGTSGRPKGAMLSARALLANLAQLAALSPPVLTAGDVVFVPIPLFHIFGMNAALGLALHARASTVVVDRFDAAESLRLMAAESVDVVVGVPAQFAAWAGQPGFADGFATARLALSGSAPLQPSLVDSYAAIGVPLYEGYGLTETSPVLTANLVGAGRRPPPKPGSVGRPLPGVELKLLDDDGTPMSDDDQGFVCVRGANLFSGYWPDGADGPDDDGWWATGDIGYVGEDGDLHLVDRSSDLVIVNGFNVYPAEVERVLLAQPSVAEVAVFGVPDERTGEAVSAYVVPVPGQTVDVDDLQAAAVRELAGFKVPRRIEVVDRLPHTATGKVMRWRLAVTRNGE